MATIVNNPSDNSGGVGLLIGGVIIIIILALFFIYGLPAIRRGGVSTPSTANINVTLPGTNGGSGGTGSGQ